MAEVVDIEDHRRRKSPSPSAVPLSIRADDWRVTSLVLENASLAPGSLYVYTSELPSGDHRFWMRIVRKGVMLYRRSVDSFREARDLFSSLLPTQANCWLISS